MAGQLNSFVQKFYNLWNTGNDACLNLECHAGKAQIHLQLNLHLQPQPQHQHQPRHHPPSPPQQPRRHLGPSQLRRRARRELVRATAAEAANPAAENADDDAAPAPLAEQAQPPHNNGPQHAAAVQAGHLPAEQAQFPLQPPQVCDSVCPDPQHAAAVQAEHLPAEQAQFPLQPPQVCDSVCPDYETLPAAQVAPLHHPPYQDRPVAPQQDRQLPAHHEIERRYGLRRVLLQQRHLQAQEDQPIHTVENEDEPPEHHHSPLEHQQDTHEEEPHPAEHEEVHDREVWNNSRQGYDCGYHPPHFTHAPCCGCPLCDTRNERCQCPQCSKQRKMNIKYAKENYTYSPLCLSPTNHTHYPNN